MEIKITVNLTANLDDRFIDLLCNEMSREDAINDQAAEICENIELVLRRHAEKLMSPDFELETIEWDESKN